MIGGMRKWWEQAGAEFAKPENWLRYAGIAGHIVIILALAWLITRLVRRWMRRLRTYIVRAMDKRGAGSTIEMENRATTIIAVLSKLSGTAIWIVACTGWISPPEKTIAA